MLEQDDRIAALCAMFGCEGAAATLLDRELMSQHFAPRQTIAHQGDPAEHCWFVFDGAARVQLIGIDGKGVQLALHGPGEVFGAYPAATTHRADVVAYGETDLMRIPTGALAGLVRANAQIAAGLAALLARQLDMAMDRMAARTTYTAAGRVHAELLRLADESGRIAPAPVVAVIALSANTTRETASRTLAALIRRGIVRREGGSLEILSRRMLAELVY